MNSGETVFYCETAAAANRLEKRKTAETPEEASPSTGFKTTVEEFLFFSFLQTKKSRCKDFENKINIFSLKLEGKKRQIPTAVQ